MDGLHLSTQEEEHRVWTVICELDLQTSFDFGLPSLLYNLEGLPSHLSLRLEVSKRLHGGGKLSDAETMQYTQQLLDLNPRYGESPRQVMECCQSRECIIALHREHLGDWMSWNLCYQMACDNGICAIRWHATIFGPWPVLGTYRSCERTC